MSRKRFTRDIIGKLQEAEVAISAIFRNLSPS
jgi:hypothetical protein